MKASMGAMEASMEAMEAFMEAAEASTEGFMSFHAKQVVQETACFPSKNPTALYVLKRRSNACSYCCKRLSPASTCTNERTPR